MKNPPRGDGIDPPPLTARSVVLSILLGAHPPELPARELVRVAEDFDITESTLRVALTRMVTAGDLRRSGSSYRLSDRLIERQRRQDNAVHPLLLDWSGAWEIVVVTATGRNAGDRADLRTRLSALRVAELREGLWLRPRNLARPWPADLAELVERFTGHPEGDPHDLVRRLWDVDGWADAAGALLRRFHAAVTPAERFTLAAAMVRALLNDPVLPEQLLDRHPWPTDGLRTAYRGYQQELVDLTSQRQEHT